MASTSLQVASSVSLYEAEHFLTELIDTAGVVEVEMEQEFQALITESLAVAIQKRERVGQFILSCEARAEHCRAEVQRIQKRARLFESVAERVRTIVLDVITGLPLVTKGKKTSYPKLEGETLTLSAVSKPEAVVISEPASVPMKFKEVSITVSAQTWTTMLAYIGAASTEEADVLIGELAKAASWTIDRSRLKAALQRKEVVPGADLVGDDFSLRVT